MPCYRCGTRQVDPVRGTSPWQRGVLADRQVLICPGCQDAKDWAAGLDRCAGCASVRLIKRLGEIECRDCGAVADSALQASRARPSPQRDGPEHDHPQRDGPAGEAVPADAVPPGLAEEVEQALARVLRRSVGPAPVG